MSDVEPSALEPARLEELGYEIVILAAPDMVGELFGKRMSPDRFRAALSSGVHASSCALGWDIGQDFSGLQLDYTGFHTGWHDITLKPVAETLRPVGWLEGVALCMADLVDDESGDPVEVAPRTILLRQIARLNELGYESFVGSELEFFLYNEDYEQARANHYRTLRPTTRTHSDYLVRQANELEPFFGQLRSSLERTGIDVEMSQCEWGLGQWEMNLMYGRAMATADAHALFKMGVKNLAVAQGLSATFMARPGTDEMGSSGHLHLSLRDPDGHSAFFDEQAEDRLSPLALRCIGGVVAHAPETMLWYAPNVNSYRRAAKEGLVAGHGCTWGFDNRTVSCRTVGGAPETLRLEWRVPGADINPYLAIAAVLASAAEGIEQEIDPGPPSLGDAYSHAASPLPGSLIDAVRAFRESQTNRRWFGDQVVDHYAAVAEYEWDQFSAEVTEWEFSRYFEGA